MKKTSILIPVILVICLIALALLVSKAIANSEQSQTDLEDNIISLELPKDGGEDSGVINDGQRDSNGLQSSQDQRFQDLVPATEADRNVTSNGETSGIFLVIAGTFRQEINARTRVRNLRDAGFTNTSLEKFDRGTYAVALVDHSPAYDEAMTLADRVRTAGFEVKVYRKR